MEEKAPSEGRVTSISGTIRHPTNGLTYLLQLGLQWPSMGLHCQSAKSQALLALQI